MDGINESPIVSVVMPCYNEEAELPSSIDDLTYHLDEAGFQYELILVDNGSKDKTGCIIDDYIKRGHPIIKICCEHNFGYGRAVLKGMQAAKGKYICHVCADGQVCGRDITNALLVALVNQRGTVVKARRATRGDGSFRKTISAIWNIMFSLLYGNISDDINGVPKVVHRDDLIMLDLQSTDAFLEAEFMIKASHLRMNVLSIPIDFRARSGSSSKIKIIPYIFEFIINMIRFKYGCELKAWKERVAGA